MIYALRLYFMHPSSSTNQPRSATHLCAIKKHGIMSATTGLLWWEAEKIYYTALSPYGNPHRRV
jgi:hypothetical protein